MKALNQTQMLEAMRLTQAGRLTDAVTALQRTLSGNASAGGTQSDHPSPSPGWTIANGHIAPETVLPSAARPALAAKPDLRLHSLTLPVSPAARGPQLSDIAPAAGRYLSGSFSDGAGSRAYKLYVPSCQSAEPRPLIVMLHGCTQSADDFAAGTRMNFAAEREGCFVVYPEQPQAANASKCWNWFRSGDQSRDQGEPALIAGITRQVMRDHNIDPCRVYVAGLSAGGAAAAIMAEAYPDIYAAVGVHSGIACGAARDLPSAFTAMRGEVRTNTAGAPRVGQRLMPTIVFHGDRDHTVHPANGADVIARATSGHTLSETIERRRDASGQSYAHSVKRDAEGRVMVELWELHGAGHAWSGGSPAGSYTNPNGPSATDAMLRFFLHHRRPC